MSFSFRRIAVPLVALLCALVAGQVVQAAPPSGDFTISDPVPEVGETVNFTATGLSDPEGVTPTDISWDFGDGSPTATGTSASHAYGSSAPTRTVSMTIADPEGGPSTTVSRTLRVNAVPTAAVSCSPPNPAPDRPIRCTSNGSGDLENGSQISYAWDTDGDEAFNDGTDPTETFFFSTGPRTIKLRVRDQDGATSTAQTTFMVANSAPTANIDTVTPLGQANGNLPYVGQDVRFNGSGTDPNGDNLSYTWSLAGVTRGGASVTHSFGSAGRKDIALTVSDGSDTDTDTTDLTVNALPVARIAIQLAQAESGQNPAVPLISQPFTLTGAGSNDAEDGAQLTYAWDINNDGQFGGAGELGQDFSHPGFTTAGARTVGLQVTDSNGAKASTTLTFRVNTPPTPRFVFEPLTPIINEEITFSANSADPDAADANLAYEWDFDLDRNGSFETSGGTSAASTRSFSTAGTYPARLRETDTGGITREVVRTVLVQNTIPTGSINFSPAAPVPGQAVTFTGSASSPSGKPIASMEWDLAFDPSSDQFDVNASGASVSHAFSSPGPKTVGLRIQETGGGFAIISRTVLVNAPPQASFNVAPGSPLDGDTVTFSSTSGDPDGPVASHDWDLDGDGQYDDASGAVIARAFDTGPHIVRLRVTDARGAAATAERNINVLKRPPKLLAGVKVTLFGNLTRDGVRLKRLLVRTPGKANVKVTCKGKKCPKGERAASTRPAKTKRVRFKKFERAFPAGTLITVTVTRPGYIGQQTTIKIRKGLRRYIRRDSCLRPGSSKPIACPDS